MQRLLSILARLTGRVPPTRALFHRHIRLSSNVVAWLRHPKRTPLETLDFAELLLRLDSDPARYSEAVISANAPPGMRWASFGSGRKAILIWNIPRNEVRIIVCIEPTREARND